MNRSMPIVALAVLMLTACGKEAPPPAAPAATSAAKNAAGGAAAVAALDDKKAQEIMDKSGCTACHAIDKKVLGPAYADVASKRKGEPGAAAMLAKKVRDGGAGAYGQIPMPPNPASRISDAELKQIIDWVLSK